MMYGLNKRKSRGLAMIEFTLVVGMLLTTVAIVADLYSVNRLRGNYDRISHTMSSVLSVQRYLAAKDLEKLIDAVIPESDIGSFELHIYKVNLDRSLGWRPINRGALEGLCSSLASGGYFTGDMPEVTDDLSEESREEDETESASLIVVQLCRESDGLTPMSLLLKNKVIEVLAYNRMQYQNIKLDNKLSEELSVEDNDNE